MATFCVDWMYLLFSHISAKHVVHKQPLCIHIAVGSHKIAMMQTLYRTNVVTFFTHGHRSKATVSDYRIFLFLSRSDSNPSPQLTKQMCFSSAQTNNLFCVSSIWVHVTRFCIECVMNVFRHTCLLTNTMYLFRAVHKCMEKNIVSPTLPPNP